MHIYLHLQCKYYITAANSGVEIELLYLKEWNLLYFNALCFTPVRPFVCSSVHLHKNIFYNQLLSPVAKRRF